MSTLRNQNWLNSQTGRRYPLDGNATGTGDDGAIRLKDDIVADLHIRWPSLAGQYAFLGGLTVTDKILTVVILGADSPTAASNFTPLAAVSLEQPVNRHVYYALSPLYPGVGGFISFGDTGDEFSIRMSTPQQGLLSPRIASPYAALPIPTMRKLGRVDGLTGLVRVLGGPDIEVVKELIEVGGIEREAMVIRLTGGLDGKSVLKDYIGPCGGRPESRNCLKDGVETVNGVSPDCNGNLTIDFRELTATPYASCGVEHAGVILDQSLGIDDVCAETTVDRFAGTDSCAAEESISASESLPSESLVSLSSSSVSLSSVSSASLSCVTLPFEEFFDDPEPHASWETKAGGFVIAGPDSPYEPGASASAGYGSYQSTDGWRRNLAIFDDCGYDEPANRRVRTHFMLTKIPGRINGGLLLNYRISDPITNPLLQYFMILVDQQRNSLGFYRYNGANTILEHTVTPSTPFPLYTWMQMQVNIIDIGGGVTVLATIVTNLEDGGWPPVSVAYQTTKFGDFVGKHGIAADRAVTNFAYWRLENL
jgi:hypothetical protein